MHDGTPSLPATRLDRENLFILAAEPAGLLVGFAGLIGAACARGRPPVVVVLGDGCGPGAADATARRLERETRAALETLGVPEEFALFAGFHEGAAPRSGPRFAHAVRTLGLVLWRRDASLLVAPDGTSHEAEAARAMAAALAEEFGLPWALAVAGGPAGVALHAQTGPALRLG